MKTRAPAIWEGRRTVCHWEAEMKLEGGPKDLDGLDIPAPPDPWVWVARCDGKTHVFDPSRPEDAQRTLGRVDREQWAEYQQDPGDPSVYRFCRSLPARPR